VSGYDQYIGSAAQFNLAAYEPTDVNKLISAGLAASSAAERFPIYSELLRHLAEDVPYVPLYVDDYSVAIDRKFTIPAFDPWAFQFDDFALQVKPVS
jgi:ABC-type oligopeptide transport system substrate-binding subunit